MGEQPFVNVNVVVKGFDGPTPSFRARVYQEGAGERVFLPREEGDIVQLKFMDVPDAANPPVGAPVYGLVVGHSWAYPVISFSLSKPTIELELIWWNRDIGDGKGIARMMEPAVLEAAPSMALPHDFVELAKECQAPEQPVGFMAAWPRSGKWRGVRDKHLEAFPDCAACGGTKMLNVHHKMPFHLRPELELDPANLITLCEVPSHACHFALGHCFNWSAYNPHVEEDAARLLSRVKGRLAEA